jgi:hypothetical protein
MKRNGRLGMAPESITSSPIGQSIYRAFDQSADGDEQSEVFAACSQVVAYCFAAMNPDCVPDGVMLLLRCAAEIRGELIDEGKIAA